MQHKIVMFIINKDAVLNIDEYSEGPYIFIIILTGIQTVHCGGRGMTQMYIF